MKNKKTKKFVAQIIKSAIDNNLYNDPEIKDVLIRAIRRASEGFRNWHAHTDYISKNIKERLDDFSSERKYHLSCNKKYRHEHIVPSSVLYNYIKTIKNPTEKNIYQCLNKYCITATITIEEDEILNNNGFQKSMPPEFYDKNSDLYNDPFARYKKANIYKNLQKRSKNK